MAVKAGGGDPAVNGKLRDLIAKAKQNNVCLLYTSRCV